MARTRKTPTKFAQSGHKGLKRPVPNLSVGKYHTKSSAIHEIKFTGALVHWEDFEDEVIAGIEELRPKLEGIITHENLSRVPSYYMTQEHVQAGDEHGVQGRFQQHVGQVVSAVLKAGGFPVKFSDYRASSSKDYNLIPDVAIIDVTTCDLRGVGEIKVPWVGAHDLDAIFNVEAKLQTALGKLKYGLFSTYDMTIFLKQEQSQNGTWELHYSSIVEYSQIGGVDKSSLRECAFYLAVLASGGHGANNQTPLDSWVE
ncbi:hypothetical protein UA08_06226 [Talaromyces atroroseus]|uniref:Fungal-type protein kinase domain-containing protein n=1 Tax=Talaromyces atroroseus TaxID=1441469 RepID=A0A225AH41_TALAT|nr:hypothetical protein UA08_06226 [Talaromyces atroroseus]OKL58543.1 hypothetical protein UA08_06226 [Talaromyces atroroseus]